MGETQTREAVGLFHDEKTLQDAADELLINGFNHADLSAEKTPPAKHKNKASGVSMSGTITAVDPLRLLSFTFGSAGEVTFELTPKGEDVLLVARAGLMAREDMLS